MTDVNYDQLKAYHQTLKKRPPAEVLRKTPDGKALYVPIGYIAAMLDRIYLGCWKTKNFRYQVIGNEISGVLDLEIFHPVLKEWLTRTGAASVVIMVDALSDADKNTMTKKERNAHALDVMNKKPNALATVFPTLLTQCLKNAAHSLGPVFGRNINYKPEIVSHSDLFASQVFTPASGYAPISSVSLDVVGVTREDVVKLIEDAKDIPALLNIHATYGNTFDIKDLLTNRRIFLTSSIDQSKK